MRVWELKCGQLLRSLIRREEDDNEIGMGCKDIIFLVLCIFLLDEGNLDIA